MGNTESYSDETETNEEIGTRIYELAQKMYPDCCEKVTGMLLETDRSELQELVENRELLVNRINTAAKVLNKRSGASITDIQVIGDRVFGTVQQLYPALAEKVTGMLLEIGQDKLCEILADKGALIQHIHTAAQALMETKLQEQASCTKENNIKTGRKHHKTLVTPSSLSEEEQIKQMLGEEIYGRVLGHYKNHADRITGMLLEMDIENLLEITKNTVLFKEKVTEAMKALEGAGLASQKEQKTIYVTWELQSDTKLIRKEVLDGSDIQVSLADEKQKEVLGQKLYEQIITSYPSHADHITGMLLEMDCQSLLELTGNSKLFDEKVQQAALALGVTSQ